MKHFSRKHLVWRWLTVCFLLLSMPFLANGQCENHCLDFDGSADRIRVTQGGLIPSVSDFTLESWFLANSGVACSSATPAFFKTLFYLAGPLGHIAVGECDGLLFCEGVGIPVTSLGAATPNEWHHFAVVKTATDLAFYLNGGLLTTVVIPVSPPDFSLFFIGKKPGPIGVPEPEDWLGQIDEIRLWLAARTAAEITATMNCGLAGNEPGLALYFPLDQGLAGGDNTTISQAIDWTANGLHGILDDFTKTGAASNFVASGARLAYPMLAETSLFIGDYPWQTAPLTDAVEGDGGQFCLETCVAGGSNLATIWQFSDDGGPWTDVVDPDFTGTCFAEPTISTPCATDADGVIHRKYRAKLTVIDPHFAPPITCDYFSEETEIQICCRFTPLSIDLQPTGGAFCEGDLPTFSVSLVGPAFLQNPGPLTTILWKFEGTAIPFDNLSSFVFTPSAGVLSPDACFEATVQHCLETAVVQACRPVDVNPKCFEIEPMTALQPVPGLADAWFICPGTAAVLHMETLFESCTPHWEYSFDQTTWLDLGETNSTQNTNLLPSFYWPTGAASIFYRIKCTPQSFPSACTPCFSNVIEIRLLPPPDAPTIAGPLFFCADNGSGQLSVSPFDAAALNYVWLANGAAIPNFDQQNLTVSNAACYWLEVSNGCQTIETAHYCLESCDITPHIFESFLSNSCAQLQQPAVLSACGSSSNCAGAMLNFEWNITWIDPATGFPMSSTQTGCDLTTPPLPEGGVTWLLTITDTTHGCTRTVGDEIIPCFK